MKLLKEKEGEGNGRAERTMSGVRNSQFIGSTYVQQPSVYSVQSGPVIPTYAQTPIMIPTYNPPASVYRPQMYVQPPVNIQSSGKPLSYTFTTVNPV